MMARRLWAQPGWVLAWMMMFSCLVMAKEPAKLGGLKGTLTNAESGAEVKTITLSLKGKLFERVVTVDGSFDLDGLPPGEYRLEVNGLGFEPQVTDITIKAGEVVTLPLVLVPRSLRLSEVVVAPSSYSFFSKPLASNQYLDRETIRNLPHFNDDVFRALGSVPGTSSNDFGAAIRIRGGAYREVAVNLDGMTLVNPYHLKDFTGVFSAIDPEILGGLSLATGGYSSRYGNALSGVMDMNTAEPLTRRTSASLSFGYVGFHSEGTFAEGQGSYLVSGRRGYLDLLLSFTEDDEEEGDSSIAYYDAYAKVRYVFNPRHALSGHFFAINDTFEESEQEEGEVDEADSSYGDYYLWAKLDSSWTDRLSSTSILSASDLDQKRKVSTLGGVEEYDIRDNRNSKEYGFKQDWEWRQSNRSIWQFGWEWKESEGSYDYRGVFENEQPVGGVGMAIREARLNPEGEEQGAYLLNRRQFGSKLVMELGARYDRQTLFDDNQVSPRFNLAYSLGNGDTLRFATGRYYQAERVHELQVADGITNFSMPEVATHWLLSYETRLKGAVDFRAELYYKDLEDVRIRFDNLTRNLVLFPGPSADRVAIEADSATSRGLELVLKRDKGRRVNWFLNYAWSRVEDEVAGETIPRSWDQEHTLNASLQARLGPKWNFSAAFLYRSGWRTTGLNLVETQTGGGRDFEIVPDRFFGERFPDYHRLDVRVNRGVFVRGRRSFEIFLDIRNLYNRKNIRGYEEFSVITNDQGVPTLGRTSEDWLPILPSFGISWSF